MTSSPKSSEPDLGALLARVRAGDGAAAAELDRRWRTRLVRFCTGYVRSHEEAEDAVQDVFGKLLAARETPDDARVWIYRIARNACLNRVRSRARRKDGDRLATGVEPPADRTGALTGLVRADERALLSEALAGLAREEREVLLLRYADGLSREEIARVCALEVPTVKSRLYAGLTKLRERVARLATR